MLSYGDPNPVDLERQRRNKMGRPLNKRNLGDTAGSGDQIQVSADVDGLSLIHISEPTRPY